MKLTSTNDEGFQVVTVHADRLDAASAITFRKKIDAMEWNATNPLILDLSNIHFMDSSGVWALAHLCKANKSRAPVRMVTKNRAIRHLLRATGFVRLIEIHESLVDAKKSEPAEKKLSSTAAVLRLGWRLLRRRGEPGQAGSQTA